jgi:hypothetical protein
VIPRRSPVRHNLTYPNLRQRQQPDSQYQYARLLFHGVTALEGKKKEEILG